MVDYENKIHNIYGSLYLKATDKLSLYGTVIFNKSEGGMEQVVMPDAQDILHGELPNQDFVFPNMHDNSNMSYELLKLKAGFKYKLQGGITLTADGIYADLTDNEGYVYGDESGSYFMLSSGVAVEF